MEASHTISIRYCTATSKRTQKPCRARAMRGMQVCYHHGGRSLRGIAHPNYKHGYYSKIGDIRLMVAFGEYCRAVRRQQADEIRDHLKATMPCETMADFRRFRIAFRQALQALPDIKLTPELAAEIMRG